MQMAILNRRAVHCLIYSINGVSKRMESNQSFYFIFLAQLWRQFVHEVDLLEQYHI